MRIKFQNLEDLSQMVNGTELGVRQISSQPVSGWALHHSVGDMLCSAGSTSGRFTLNGSLSEELISIGYTTVEGGPARHFGKASPSQTVLVFPAGRGQDSTYGGRLHYAGIGLRADSLMAFAEREGVRITPALLKQRASYHAGAAQRIAARALISMLDAQACQGVPRSHVEDTVEGFINSLLRMLSDDDASPDGRLSCDRLMRRIDDFVATTDPAELTIKRLCEHAKVSRVTLHRAFRETYDIPPGEYIRSLRLTAARKDIRTLVRNGCSTITHVAAEYGFFEGGKFAYQYRRAFGELPSETAGLR